VLCRELHQDSFGVEQPFQLGVEEELLVVDSDFNLCANGATNARNNAKELSPELFEAQVETQSPVSQSALEAVHVLQERRRQVLESGVHIIGAGLHPKVEPGQVEITASERYQEISTSLQGLVSIPTCAQHVHVGMPDRETAVRVYNGIRLFLPALAALAGNSPYWYGRDSGLDSSRFVLIHNWPRAAMPPYFNDFDHFCQLTEELLCAAGLDDYTQIWWDARLHPKLGTVEVRIADTQFALWRAAAISAFIQCACRYLAEVEIKVPSREALAESEFQAVRFGLGAKLITADGLISADQLIKSSLDKFAGISRELNCQEELDSVRLILEKGNGAALQRQVAEEGMNQLLAWLVSESEDLTLA
jgi:glutamate---cysteine ligase / carboxylate-amine ligase